MLTTKPQTVGVSDIRAFIADHLLSPDRRLPVIVFSRDGWSEALLADPSAVADAAAGLARVVVLADKWSSFGVTNELGKSLSCFNGAVRIYWPGLTTTDDPYTHPLFLPDVLRDWQGDRRKLAHVIVRRLAPISAYRFVEGEIARSVRAAIQRRRTREEEAWREEIKSGRADKALLQEKMLASLDQLQAVQQKTRTLQSRLEEAELGALQRDEEVRSLREENTALRSSFAQVATAAARERQAAPKEARIADVHREFKSVVAALSGAERDFASRLVIWPSAKRSAEKSRYARPHEVYQGLLAIREVLDQYFKSRTDGTSMGSWEEAFEHRGFKYAGKDSQTTTTMHGKHRKFTYQGRTLQMERHLTLGGGDRENCLQIYFEVDDKAKRGIVGYCGMHLPYAGMST